MNLAIVQLNAGSNLLHIRLRQVLVQMDVIDFLLKILGMRQFGSQIPIIGEEEHTGSIAVQAAHGVDAFGAGVLHQIHHRAACLGVVRGSHRVLRLVQEDVDLTLDVHNLVVELHLVAPLDLRTQFCHHLSVDGHHACRDIFVSLTA